MIFHSLNSPIGDIHLLLQNGKLRECRLGELRDAENVTGSYGDAVRRLKKGTCCSGGCKDVACSPALRKLIVFLDDYFQYGLDDVSGIRPYLDTDKLSEFCKCVYHKLADIECGRTISYGELAEEIGRPGAARAVGTALSKNPFPIFIPCHRVIKADGGIGGFIGGFEWKCKLLKYEASI